MNARLPLFSYLLFAFGLFSAALLLYSLLRSVQQSEQKGELELVRAPVDFAPELLFLDGFQLAAVPEVEGWRMPVGTETGAFSYNAQGFGVDNAYRGGAHTGDDLNGIGGENTDFGDPIFAPARGLVVYTGEPSLGWGRIVVLAHREEGRVFTTLYAHLSEVAAPVGTVLDRGELLGRIGTSRASDYAHLHWEWRRGMGLSVLEAGYEKRAQAQWSQQPAERLLEQRLEAQGEERLFWPSLAQAEWQLRPRELQKELKVNSEPLP